MHRLSTLLAAFDAMGCERVAIVDHPVCGKTERFVTIDFETDTELEVAAAQLHAPQPIDRIQTGITWKSTRIVDDEVGLTITLTGARRHVRAA